MSYRERAVVDPYLYYTRPVSPVRSQRNRTPVRVKQEDYDDLDYVPNKKLKKMMADEFTPSHAKPPKVEPSPKDGDGGDYL